MRVAKKQQYIVTRFIQKLNVDLVLAVVVSVARVAVGD